MKKLSIRIRSFIVNPIVALGTVILFVVFIIGGQFLWLQESNLDHPGPAKATFMFALAILVTGLLISGIQTKKENNNQRKTRILGLELLIERWKTFQPKESDSDIIYEQIAITMSLAELAYKHVDQIRFLKYFAGFKIKSGAFLLQPGQEKPIVIKFDRLDNIKKEVEQYDQCVAQHLGLTPGAPVILPHQIGSIKRQEWGVIAYNLVGENTAAYNSVQTLAEYYQSCHEPQELTHIFEEVFTSLRPWWGNPLAINGCPPQPPSTLYEEYDRLIHKREIMYEGIITAIQQLLPNGSQDFTPYDTSVSLSQQLMNIGNPLNWTDTVFKAEKLDLWVKELGSRRNSIVHGDLHMGNLLVSKDKQTQLKIWVIDFPHTHVGPTIQDIARLEADIKFGMVSEEALKIFEDPKDLYEFETRILPKSNQKTPSLANLIINAAEGENFLQGDLLKAWKSVSQLRQEARKYMNGDDARPYYLALLHATMPNLYYGNRSSRQKLYAFISSSILCDCLGW